MEAGKVKGIREHHLNAGRPIRPIKSETRRTAVELTVAVGAAAPGENAGLEKDAREVCSRQHLLLSSRDVDRRLVEPGERMRGLRSGDRRLRRKYVQEGRRVDHDGALCHTQHTRQGYPAERRGLL